ncbi:hypothetical protein DFQ14_101471 [Halopolyspora algeriensis]|uniref:Uncharacterized protein n=1 Tax=Halopolyspora algeriensis TaxID=1500506 RepID=A0A368VYR4_9ACTN|nr:hypothetical protein [Halopolyspora algeriensis]RCW47127.1 hypothetical protein DFQ14_101471 [Halopolyspora algeriensis]TQM48214.1 hypothetical protein FHU43_3176 [Halopolyspora algeriensis]
MEPGVQSYVVFLVIGVALVLIDGWFIRRSGATYLAEVYPTTRIADSVNRLITVLFHLSVLGVLALISTIEISTDNAAEAVVARTGVMLLVLAVAHGITLWVMARLRSRQREQQLKDELTARTEERMEQRHP